MIAIHQVKKHNKTLHFAAISRSDIPVEEFPEYVKQMHENRDRKLEVEYKVCSYSHFLHTFSIESFVLAVSGKASSGS